MREDNNNVSKQSWKRIFKKKWFFPAVYLTVAALLLTGVLWYQNLDNQIPEATDNTETNLGNSNGNPLDYEQDSDTVVSQSEVVKMPVAEDSQTDIVTKFYDFDKTSEEQEQALVLYNNKYYQSKGIDIASASDETFSVTAALSGEVTEVKEDPLLGYVLEMEHENGVSTYYASLQDVTVKAGQKVEQGESVATSGQNVYGQASGTHVHFEIRKDNVAVDPEMYLNKPLADIKAPSAEESAEETEVTDEAEDTDEAENDETETVPNPDESTGEQESSRATTNT
ncbi:MULTISPECIES: M23 family metallopeptidase [Paraliobacillus]|uniref:M23 family metallopeptidase n=1 Tax=Paraliobacillus TaxID=200903 RepID=UPI000DD4C5F2|nr:MULTISPECIES: M23 family metallopeptidase [Paraliobacillus]